MLKSKKAFTIVELVIVIAVIAVLASVLIPTFSSIVQKAYYNVDTQTVALINKYISIHLIDSEIDSEADLKNIVDSALGEGKYDTISPKSVAQGYHFWYDNSAQRVILSKYSDLGTDQSITAQKPLMTVSNGNALPGSANKFENDNVRSCLKNGFFFMDKKGSDLAEVVEAIYSVQGKDDYISLYTKAKSFSGNSADQAVKDRLIEFIDSAVFITEEGTILKADAPAIIPKPKKYVVIAPQIIHIKNIVIELDDSFSGEPRENITIYVEIENAISLPETVEKVDSGALNFTSDDIVIETSMTEEKISECFGAASTNATITSSDGKRYTVDGTSLKNEAGEKVDDLVGDAAELISYDLTVTDVLNKVYYDKDSKTLYVAYDYSGDIEVIAENFIFNGTPSENDRNIEWSVEDPADRIILRQTTTDAILSLNGGNLTQMIADPVTLNALSVNNSVENEIKLLFVYPNEFALSLKVNGTPTTLDNERLILELSPFAPSSTELTVELADISYVNSHPNIMCDITADISLTDTTAFTIDGMRLTVTKNVPDNHEETVTVTYAGREMIFTVVFNVSNESPLYLDAIFDATCEFAYDGKTHFLNEYCHLKEGCSIDGFKLTVKTYLMKADGKYILNGTEEIDGVNWQNTRMDMSYGKHKYEIFVEDTILSFEYTVK